jgi:hypothetical protein
MAMNWSRVGFQSKIYRNGSISVVDEREAEKRRKGRQSLRKAAKKARRRMRRMAKADGWEPVPPSFWPDWRANKITLIEAGYRIKKVNGKWRMQFRPTAAPSPKSLESLETIPDGTEPW